MRFDSTVGKFPGYVILPDFLNLPQVRKFEDALIATQEIYGSEKTSTYGILDEKQLPAILECVVEWHIEGIPDKPNEVTFPLTPKKAASELVRLIFSRLLDIYTGEIEIPNG